MIISCISCLYLHCIGWLILFVCTVLYASLSARQVIAINQTFNATVVIKPIMYATQCLNPLSVAVNPTTGTVYAGCTSSTGIVSAWNSGIVYNLATTSTCNAVSHPPHRD
jgi:hypothetical protein